MENEIFKAFIDLVSMINRPDRDKKMIAEAGVNLEEAAFRVFVGIGHVQPTSVGDLAAMMGKNYSSVSRQIDKLEAAGLVHTYPSSSDYRIRVSELTKSGEELNTMISLTRDWLTNIFNTLSHVETARKYVRIQGDSPDMFLWYKEYLMPETEKHIYLENTHRNPLPDNELAVRLKNVLVEN